MLLISCAIITIAALLAGVLSHFSAPIWLVVVPSVVTTSLLVPMWVTNMKKTP
ncbi:cytochrome c biogenesis protein CcdA [Pseudarthrobacter sulfonivorans]|nr:cytochrome c biogenesis protein CcdA [Pseudarthrobacter sulfonivorans]